MYTHCTILTFINTTVISLRLFVLFTSCSNWSTVQFSRRQGHIRMKTIVIVVHTFKRRSGVFVFLCWMLNASPAANRIIVTPPSHSLPNSFSCIRVLMSIQTRHIDHTLRAREQRKKKLKSKLTKPCLIYTGNQQAPQQTYTNH